MPLHALLAGRPSTVSVLTWTSVAGEAFDSVNELLAMAVQLTNRNNNAEMSIMVDASDLAIGAVPQNLRTTMGISLRSFLRNYPLLKDSTVPSGANVYLSISP